MIEALVQTLETEAAGEALSALCSEAKTKAGREQIEVALGTHETLYALLETGTPKVRKNVYRLLGALENETDIPVLARALETETTLFAVPSLILALGNLGAEEVLCGYTVPASESPETDKHIAAIAAAYGKAMQQFDRVEAERLYRLPAAREILCCAPAGFAKELQEELDALGFAGKIAGDAVRITAADVARVYRATAMTEALLPIAARVPLDPAALAKAVGPCIGKRYRIELRGYLKDRAKLIERLKLRLDGVNAPSNYDCELRIVCHGEDADLYWKLWNVPDERYPWRVGTVPASIHPATASALVRYARKLVDAPPAVFDPFCGSGSLLFAAEAAFLTKGLLGVDCSAKAIAIARKNAEAAGSKARFVCRDILRFDSPRGAGLIVSNLPFGNRVGSHRENEALYARFVHKLPGLLSDGGAAVLYTADGKLLERLLKAESRLELAASFRTEAGGLKPVVFAVRKKGL
ncbi:MAG: methyltransferase domain-containing protein [Clostridia bacterium]|nr:methyltransferase domain-containing protein [Clostridia bacterium]